MRRVHGFELEDQAWFPAVLRDAGTAFLRFGAERIGQARAIRPVIEQVLDLSGTSQIVDLCSGGGGPSVAIARSLRAAGSDVRVTMTDLYPSAGARARVARDGDDLIVYDPAPVDATEVPAEHTGLRTMFNAFHHFRPEQAAVDEPRASVRSMSTISGSCHCGALSVALETSRAADELPVRSCTCGFCTMRRARWTSDPGGLVIVAAASESSIIRYRFATGTADFMMCAVCGIHVVAAMELDGATYAVINVDALSIARDIGDRAVDVSFAEEATPDRLERRKGTWTPAVVRIG